MSVHKKKYLFWVCYRCQFDIGMFVFFFEVYFIVLIS